LAHCLVELLDADLCADSSRDETLYLADLLDELLPEFDLFLLDISALPIDNLLYFVDADLAIEASDDEALDLDDFALVSLPDVDLAELSPELFDLLPYSRLYLLVLTL